MNYSEWFWTECDILCSDTNFVHNLAEKCWDFRQKEIDELKTTVQELTQALIKEQEEVLKYKPIYLKLIAENERLKQQINCNHTFVGRSENSKGDDE